MAPPFRNARVYLLATIAYLGSFLFGYDTGVMSSVLALPSFKSSFGLPSDASAFASARAAEISSNVVALLTAGCFFGALAAPPLAEALGRRAALMCFAAVFLVGAATQTGASSAIGVIYAGRVVAGLGIGGMSSVTPVYVAENAPADVRGRIAGLFQEFLVLGSTTAYWVGYGVSLHLEATPRQWRVPVGLQLVPGGVMLFGLVFLHESPRWLVKKGRHEEAVRSLCHMRGVGEEGVAQELGEIRAAIELELQATEGVTWKECLKPGVRYRFITGFLVMFWQQFSGTNSIGYYAPQIFQTVGIGAANASLFATGIYGSVKVVATGLFLLVGIETLGRRKSLMIGAAWMASMMIIIGAVLATHPPDTKSTAVSPASIGMVAMIYLYVIGYSASWGPIPWVYLSEIFPTRVRAYGVGMGSATQWLFNFVITKVTPAAINSIGWRTFLMFGIFCVAMGVFVFFCIKETKGLMLEEMDVLFGMVDADQRRRDVENAVAVEKASAAKAGNAEHVEDVEVSETRGKS